MKIKLADHGRSFATRARADEILAALPKGRTPKVVVDMDGASVTPSFLAQLLSGLSPHTGHIVVVVESADVTRLVESLSQHLGLSQTVRVEPPVPA